MQEGMVLLEHMNKFMCYQFLTNTRPRSVLSSSKYNILANCIGKGIDLRSGFCCFNICMHTYIAEIVSESWLHKRSRFRVERFSWRPQHLIDNRRHLCRFSLIRCFALQQAAAHR